MEICLTRFVDGEELLDVSEFSIKEMDGLLFDLNRNQKKEAYLKNEGDKQFIAIKY